MSKAKNAICCAPITRWPFGVEHCEKIFQICAKGELLHLETRNTSDKILYLTVWIS